MPCTVTVRSVFSIEVTTLAASSDMLILLSPVTGELFRAFLFLTPHCTCSINRHSTAVRTIFGLEAGFAARRRQNLPPTQVPASRRRQQEVVNNYELPAICRAYIISYPKCKRT